MAMLRSRGRTPVDRLAADRDAAAVDLLEPGDGAQERGLAAARRPDKNTELAFGNIKVDAAQGMDLAVVFLQAADGQAAPCAQPLTAPSDMPRTR